MVIYIKKIIEEPTKYCEGVAEVLIGPTTTSNRIFVGYNDSLKECSQVVGSILFYGDKYGGIWENEEDLHDHFTKGFTDTDIIERYVPVGFDYSNNGRFVASGYAKIRGTIIDVDELDEWYYPTIKCNELLIDSMTPKPESEYSVLSPGKIIDVIGYLRLLLDD